MIQCQSKPTEAEPHIVHLVGSIFIPFSSLLLATVLRQSYQMRWNFLLRQVSYLASSTPYVEHRLTPTMKPNIYYQRLSCSLEVAVDIP